MPCPVGQQLGASGHCFHLYTSNVTWQQARETCQGLYQGDLAVLDGQSITDSLFPTLGVTRWGQVSVCVCVCMCVCTCVHACEHMCACMHVCMHTCVYACMHMCVCVCMHACVCLCMLCGTVYVCMHVCVYVLCALVHVCQCVPY